jgi:transcription antitermination factor NusG
MQQQWYAIRTQVGYEQKVASALQRKIHEREQDDAFGEIIVPSEKVIDVVRGQKREVERRLFPGYLLVQMVLTDRTWHVVHSVPKVVGFIGESATSPTPVLADAIDKIRQQGAVGHAAPRPKFASQLESRLKSSTARSRTSTASWNPCDRNGHAYASRSACSGARRQSSWTLYKSKQRNSHERHEGTESRYFSCAEGFRGKKVWMRLPARS